MLADGHSVWVAWAGLGFGRPETSVEMYQAEVVSAADKLVRRKDDGRMRVLYYEKVFETETEAKAHIASTLDAYASELQSIASRYR
jgi:hypothetical protein